ncbi:MAG: LPS export ABC transporter ATP-binding protein [Holosporales bacterium]|nr:LPS export ABC transporter ATP-binding protein [Holosporales bacterium]
MLKVKNITKAFKDRIVLNRITAFFPVGQIVGILGPNGAGKTTLFSILAGISQADSGTIELNGKDITNLKVHRRSKAGIVYLPQDASIFRGLSVEDNIRAILEITYFSKNKVKSTLDDLLEAFSLSHLRTTKATLLSGGERRKVEIARALATSPMFLMLDEPFSGIDPISVSEIMAIVRNLKDSGIGIIITDHNVRETLRIMDQGYILVNGKILIHGTPQDIVNDENTRKQYLGETFRV